MGIFGKMKDSISAGADAINKAKKTVQKSLGAEVTEEEINNHLMKDEILYNVITQSVMANVKSVALTSKRIVIIEKKLTKTNFIDYRWGHDIKDVHVEEDLTSAKLTIALKSGEIIKIDKLGKIEGKAFYTKAQEVEENFLDFEHKRELEKAKAGAAHINTNIMTDNQTSKSKVNVKEKLQEIKELLDEGLIDEEEFKQKKQEILKSI